MIDVYLACPYTHVSKEVRDERVELATLAAAKLMDRGFSVYSPITHGHAIADHLPPATAEQHKFWMDQCAPFMHASHRLFLLPLQGWRMSRGVREELAAFRLAGKVIAFLQTPSEWRLDQPREQDLLEWMAVRVDIR